MPLGTPVSAGPPTGSASGNVRHFTGIANEWKTVISASATPGSGGLQVQDVGVPPAAGTITNPDTEITDSTRVMCHIQGRGSTVECRMGYDDGDTIPNSVVIRVFGRAGNDQWMRLKRVGQASASQGTITSAATDASDGTLNYTNVIATARFQLLGCDTILIGVENNYAMLGGTPQAAFLQARVV